MTAIFKVISHNYGASWQRQLKDTMQFKILQTWINIGDNPLLSKYLKTKIDKRAWEIISCSKSEPTLRRTLRRDIWLIIVHFSFSHTSLVFEFNIVFVDRIIFATIYFPFYLLIFCILKFIKYLYAFFTRSSKILMKLNVAFWSFTFTKHYFFYFPWNICTCWGKTTLGVNNSF